MEVGEVPKGIRWSAKAGGPPKVRIGGVSGRGRGLTIKSAFYCESPTPGPTHLWSPLTGIVMASPLPFSFASVRARTQDHRDIIETGSTLTTNCSNLLEPMISFPQVPSSLEGQRMMCLEPLEVTRPSLAHGCTSLCNSGSHITRLCNSSSASTNSLYEGLLIEGQ